MTIRPTGAELFRADGWTDTRKRIVAFRNFANAPINGSWHGSYVHMRVGNAKCSTYEPLRLCKQVHNAGDKEMFIIAQRAIILERKVIEQQHGTDVVCNK
jgi:hypothetical protein